MGSTGYPGHVKFAGVDGGVCLGGGGPRLRDAAKNHARVVKRKCLGHCFCVESVLEFV